MKLTPRSFGRPSPLLCSLRRVRCRKIGFAEQSRSCLGRSDQKRLTTTETSCLITAALIGLFGLLQITDGVVTYLGLDSFGLAEANPLLLAVARFVGLAGAIAAVKLCGLAFITFLFFDRHKMGSRWITASLVSADTFYSWVVANNVSLVLAA
jgi:Domain of unknown function (DUF5658)